MSLGSITRLVAVSALLSGFVVACVVESDRQGYGSGGSAGTSPPPTPTGSSTGNGAASPNPILVDVDTGRTMNAQPGEGVGVFTEYTAGGHWHVWWTCDTNQTGASCAMDVVITVATGKITNATTDAAALASGLSASSQRLEATSTTTTTTDGVRFDTDPGAIITLDASIGGVHDGSFLFFVQGGKVNGGFTGTLTDPLKLEGSSP